MLTAVAGPPSGERQVVATSSSGQVAYVVPRGHRFIGRVYSSSFVLNGVALSVGSSVTDVELLGGSVIMASPSGSVSVVGIER